MWAPLVLASTLILAPAQGGDLQVKNVRPTFGIFGQERKSTKMLPGDVLFVSFDIENLQVTDEGRIQYSMALELYSKKDKKKVFEKRPEDLEGINSLGGSRLPAFALTEIGTDTPAGEYSLTVVVTDRASKKSTKITQDFEVLPMAFGLTRVGFTYETGQPAPPFAVSGQSIIVNFFLVGFDLKAPGGAKDDKMKQPNLEVEMRIMEEGKPTLAKPFVFQTKEVKEEFKKLLPMQFTMQLNRPGTFKVVVKATDKSSGKTIEQSLDLVVK